jgi:hypothetical protein
MGSLAPRQDTFTKIIAPTYYVWALLCGPRAWRYSRASWM